MKRQIFWFYGSLWVAGFVGAAYGALLGDWELAGLTSIVGFLCWLAAAGAAAVWSTRAATDGPTAQLWVRCGDADDYHGFPGLVEAADYLAECGVERVSAGSRQYGLAADEFRFPWNYISFYWGELGDSVDPLREVTAAEIAAVNRYLAANRETSRSG